jgi:hypothetical protein
MDMCVLSSQGKRGKKERKILREKGRERGREKREREYKTPYPQAIMAAKDRKFPVDLVYKLSFKFAFKNTV